MKNEHNMLHDLYIISNYYHPSNQDGFTQPISTRLATRAEATLEKSFEASYILLKSMKF